MRTKEIIQKAKAAKYQVMRAGTEEKNDALRLMAQALLDSIPEILAANEQDVKNAEGRISTVMIDRLRLDEKRIKAMAQGILDVVALPDPVGKITETFYRPNGLEISKTQVPMGVISIIYESRPNVTSDAAALALKAGSSCVLRSGRDAHGSAEAIVKAMKDGLSKSALPADALFLVEDISHASSEEIMKAHGDIDLLIPRGGKRLISACVENANVPVLETGTGICHIFVDKTADIDKALAIIENAKCSRPSVCNAEEVLLVHEDIAEVFLPKLKERLVDNRAVNPVELRLDQRAGKIIQGTPAGEDDFDTEFLDYILAVHVVSGVEEAVSHINAHSTGHSEAIITSDPDSAAFFASGVDSACVYVNASTRFTDGGEFGFGCEMGISTGRLHARGPMGLNELCTFKYVIKGDGQVR